MVKTFLLAVACLLSLASLADAQGPCYCHSGQFRQPYRPGFNLQFGVGPRYRFTSDGYDDFSYPRYAQQQQFYGMPQRFEFNGYLYPQYQGPQFQPMPSVRDYPGYGYPQQYPQYQQFPSQLFGQQLSGCSAGNCRR